MSETVIWVVQGEARGGKEGSAVHVACLLLRPLKQDSRKGMGGGKGKGQQGRPLLARKFHIHAAQALQQYSNKVKVRGECG